MPAARPSQASLGNAISALVEAGLMPVALQVSPDGSFRFEILEVEPGSVCVARLDPSEHSEAPSWDDAT